MAISIFFSVFFSFSLLQWRHMIRYHEKRNWNSVTEIRQPDDINFVQYIERRSWFRWMPSGHFVASSNKICTTMKSPFGKLETTVHTTICVLNVEISKFMWDEANLQSVTRDYGILLCVVLLFCYNCCCRTEERWKKIHTECLKSSKCTTICCHRRRTRSQRNSNNISK